MTDLPSVQDAFSCDPDCSRCLGTGHVCEDHPDQPWGQGEAVHDCGAAGMPCPGVIDLSRLGEDLRRSLPSARPRGRRRSDSLVRVKGVPPWKARKILGRD